jgi:hypothetical protein
MIPTLNESVKYSKTPSISVELLWSSGTEILALSAILLCSAEWRKTEDDREIIECDWGPWIITLSGYGLKSLPGALVRGEICAITEQLPSHVDLFQGPVVAAIRAVKKKIDQD